MEGSGGGTEYLPYLFLFCRYSCPVMRSGEKGEKECWGGGERDNGRASTTGLWLRMPGLALVGGKKRTEEPTTKEVKRPDEEYKGEEQTEKGKVFVFARRFVHFIYSCNNPLELVTRRVPSVYLLILSSNLLPGHVYRVLYLSARSLLGRRALVLQTGRPESGPPFSRGRARSVTAVVALCVWRWKCTCSRAAAAVAAVVVAPAPPQQLPGRVLLRLRRQEILRPAANPALLAGPLVQRALASRGDFLFGLAVSPFCLFPF